MAFCEVYRAGQSGYYAAQSKENIVVFEDNHKYVYDVADFRSAKDFKRFAYDAFSCGGRKCVKITGRYPTYNIETSA